MSYEVQTQMMNAWENCWTDGEGKPVTFATIADAVQAIKSHLTDCINAVEGGDMEDSPDPSEFRIVGNGDVYEFTGLPWDYQAIGDTPKRIAQLQKERVDYADCAARAYLNAKGENNPMALCETDISDLLADLYHLADSLGFDREQMEERALGHYGRERGVSTKSNSTRLHRPAGKTPVAPSLHVCQFSSMLSTICMDSHISQPMKFFSLSAKRNPDAKSFANGSKTSSRNGMASRAITRFEHDRRPNLG